MTQELGQSGSEHYRDMDAYISVASDIKNGQLLLLVFISAILGLGKGGVPGFATVATALTVATAPLSVHGGLGFAVSLQVPIVAMIDISAAYLHRKSIDWYTTWLLLPLSFVGMGIGQIIDKYLTDALARIMVGFILLAILSFRVWDDIAAALIFFFRNPVNDYNNTSRIKKHNIMIQNNNHGNNYDDIESLNPMKSIDNKKRKTSPPPHHHHHGNEKNKLNNDDVSITKMFGWAIVVGIFGGAATMLTNSMGPILNVYLLSVRKLSPTEYIGTRAIFFCLLNVGKIPMRFISGALAWRMIPLAFGLGLVAVVGVFCAKPIMLKMKEETFVKLELLVVAIAGSRLMWLGLTMLSQDET